MPSHTTVPAVDPPAITRRRRPFLVPVWLGLLAVVALTAVGLALWASASNTLVIVVPAALGQVGSIANAPLSASGGQQARRIAQRFATATGPEGLDAIYVGDTRRAKQTAAPLAQLLGLKPVVLASTHAGQMAGEILGQHAGDTLLVVCNRQFLAALIRALSGKRIEAVAERDMYVVSIPRYGSAKILRMRN